MAPDGRELLIANLALIERVIWHASAEAKRLGQAAVELERSSIAMGALSMRPFQWWRSVIRMQPVNHCRRLPRNFRSELRAGVGSTRRTG